MSGPKGGRIRPTTGQVREALFNILSARVPGCRVLDLYAGTGALGIEALSRGAAAAVFIEADPRCVEAILQNAARARFREPVTVIRGRLPGALAALEGEFDLVFLDPPYDDEAGPELLAVLAGLLAPGGAIVYEHSSRYNPPERPGQVRLVERRTYGDTAIAIYEAEEEA